MKAIALILLLACGIVGAQPVTELTGLKVKRPAQSNDGHGGGVYVERDARYVYGGIPGNVNSALTVQTRAGQYGTTFEWAGLYLLDNFADAGENVALYAQANVYGTGRTWAFVSEITDTLGGNRPIVSQEVDLFTTGPDNGSRIGIDVTLGDGRLKRNLGASTGVIGGSAGLRIGGPENTRWTRGIQLLGNHIVGIDTSTAKTNTAIRLGIGQTIAFDQYDSITMSYNNGRIIFANSGTPVFSIDVTNGRTFGPGQ